MLGEYMNSCRIKHIAFFCMLMIMLFLVGFSSAASSLDSDPLHQFPAVSGKISYFSSSDQGGCDEAAWGEFLGPNCGEDDATKYWYVAMRWPYAGLPADELYKVKDWWHNKKILVTNLENGKQVVLAVKDWGPAEKTGRVIDVSKTAIDALGANTDDIVNIEFADQNAELGVYTGESGSSTLGNYEDEEEVESEVFQWPADMNTCAVSNRYNALLSSGYHSGMDVSGSGEQKILASASGRVVNIIKNDVGCASNCEGPGKGCKDHGFGNTVIIEHQLINGKKIYSMYAHLASIEPGIEEGSYVKGGITKIGIMGATGYGQDNYWTKCVKNTNSHLHFEIKDSNTLSNPKNPPGTTETVYGYATGNPDGYGYHNPENYLINDKIRVVKSYGSDSESAYKGQTSVQWEFNIPGDLEGWEPHNIEGSQYSVEGGRFFIDPAGSDPWIEKNGLYIDASSAKYVNFEMSSNCPDNVGVVYFTTTESPAYGDDKKVEFTASTGPEWYDYSVPMVDNSLWRGTVTGIRIDPANNGIAGTNEDTVGFEYIRVEETGLEVSV